MKPLPLPRFASDPARLSLLCLLVTLVVQLLIRALSIDHGILNVDESFFAACAVRAIHEHTIPLLACIDNKPPGAFLFYQIVFSVFGTNNMFAVHAAGAIWVFATSAAVFMAARELSGRIAACWAAIFYLLLSSGDYRLLAVKTELLMALPLSLSLWLFLRSLRTDSRAGMLASGALMACAACFKQPAILACAGIGITLLAMTGGSRKMRKPLIQGLIFAAGLILPLGLLALYYDSVGGLDDLLYQTLQYPSQYATVDTTPLSKRLMRMVTATDEYSRLNPYCWLAAALGLCVTIATSQADNAGASGKAAPLIPQKIFLASTLLALIAAVSLGREFYLAYYIFVFPLIALAGAKFMQDAFTAGPPVRRIALTLGVLAIASSSVLAGIGPVKRLLGRHETKPPMPISVRINTLSRPGDSLYVWGYMPEFFDETHLRGASKVLLSDHLQGLYAEYTPGLKAADRMHLVKPENWVQFMSDLDKNKPRFIVDISTRKMKDGDAITFTPDNYPRFATYLQTHCKIDMVDQGTKLYVCNEERPAKPSGAGS